MKSSRSLSPSFFLLRFAFACETSSRKGGEGAMANPCKSKNAPYQGDSFPPKSWCSLFPLLAQSADLSGSSAIKSMYKWVPWKSRAWAPEFCSITLTANSTATASTSSVYWLALPSVLLRQTAITTSLSELCLAFRNFDIIDIWMRKVFSTYSIHTPIICMHINTSCARRGSFWTFIIQYHFFIINFRFRQQVGRKYTEAYTVLFRDHWAYASGFSKLPTERRILVRSEWHWDFLRTYCFFLHKSSI